jgi:hypothetical protein
MRHCRGNSVAMHKIDTIMVFSVPCPDTGQFLVSFCVIQADVPGVDGPPGAFAGVT